MLCSDRQDVAALTIERVGAIASIVRKAKLFACNEVNRDMLFENGDVRIGAYLLC